MFPGAPPALRVALRHRRGAILCFGLLAFFLLLCQQSQTPPPSRPPEDITLIYPDPTSYPNLFDISVTAPPVFLIPRASVTSPPPTIHQNQTGTRKPPSKVVIMARTSGEDTSWIDEPADPSSPSSPSLRTAWSMQLYTTDTLSIPGPHTPLNKGREAMAYLGYVIDHYDALPDLMLFLHSHRSSWHDNLFGLDAVAMLRRLRLDEVMSRENGYVNLRCGWDPGCPDHIHPHDTLVDVNKPEQAVFGSAWREIFPLDEVPGVLSQPCCAQFAVTREAVRTRARAEYVLLRDWLMGTELEDLVSGRVLECNVPPTLSFADPYISPPDTSIAKAPLKYTKPPTINHIFTKTPTYCPDEENCYCALYSICFPTSADYRTFMDKVARWNELNNEVYEFASEPSVPFNSDGINELVDLVLGHHPPRNLTDILVEKGIILTASSSSNENGKEVSDEKNGGLIQKLGRIVEISKELRELGPWLGAKQDEVLNREGTP
ncbi:hypothetical protein QBC47DRAFT_443559 [Echria macrotheca]|uniref:Uncharacterized protein n=1 Tax=Echria macrotheca TaxID=438768 RepID=A0AAJ0FD84_9PEZI|nr:hypothetical protein QBC47DRAFT_443559 [Echria macrotheca]